MALNLAYTYVVIPASLTDIIGSDPEILGGAVCFLGSRVPVRILLDYVDSGDGLEAFLIQYPTIQEAHARRVLVWQREVVLDLLDRPIAS